MDCKAQYFTETLQEIEEPERMKYWQDVLAMITFISNSPGQGERIDWC